MDTDDSGFVRISERIIGCAFTVANTLGSGFTEKVYENALAYELRKSGLAVEQQHGVTVKYDGMTVSEYAADILVEGSVIVELKAVRELNDKHRAQCLNYLKATGLRLCLLINFGKPRLEVKRLMLRGADPIRAHLCPSVCICGFKIALTAWRPPCTPSAPPLYSRS